MTKQQELDKLELETEKKRVAIEVKWAIIDGLGDELKPYDQPTVMYYPLHGRKGIVHFFRKLDPDKLDPNSALFKSLRREFPPVPMILHDDGVFKTFRPDNKPQMDLKGSIYDIYPVIVHIDVTEGTKTATFKWFSEICTAPAWVRNHDIADESLHELWEFRLSVDMAKTKLGEIVTETTKDRVGRIYRWVRCQYIQSAEANDAQKIAWASGGREYPPSFELYWDPDSGKAVNWPNMVGG